MSSLILGIFFNVLYIYTSTAKNEHVHKRTASSLTKETLLAVFTIDVGSF